MRPLSSARILLSLLPLSLLGSITPHSAIAQTAPAPSLLSYQGRLAKPDGTPVADGSYAIRFSLYSAASGGTKLWEQTFAAVAVRNGVFASLLDVGTGFQNGATAATLFNGSLFLEIKIGADAALAPRQPLTSVAYALKATTVPDGSITASKLANGVTVAPGGAAGGDLVGTYPNPELRTAASSLFKVSGTLMSALAGSTSSIDQGQSFGPQTGLDSAWQSFTPSQNGNLTAIEVLIGTTTGVNKTIPITLYQGEGTAGTALASTTVVVTPTQGFQFFQLSVPVPVVAGQKYTWYMGRSSSLKFGYAEFDPYNQGRSDLGETLDYAFRTYMTTGSSTISINANVATTGRVGIGVASPLFPLDVSGGGRFGGDSGITGDHSFEFGYGINGKAANAGQIDYGRFTPNTLEIIGGGVTGGPRKIKLWSEAGVSMSGGISLDEENANNRTLVPANAIVFGGAGSGEGILSRRTAGNGQFGLDLFTGNQSRLTISNSGFIGMGLPASASPQQQLHLNGNLLLENTGTLFAKNSAGVAEGAFWPRWSDNVTYLNYGTGGFSIRNNTNAQTLFMSTNNRVGIGTTSPGAPLSISGFTGAVRQSFISSDGDNSTLRIAHPAPFVAALGGNTNHALQIGGFANDGSAFTPRVTLTASGNVGIGTTAPIAPLQVATNSARGLIVGNPANGGGHIDLGTDAGWPTIQGVQSEGTAYGTLRINPAGGNTNIGSVNGAIYLFGLTNIGDHRNVQWDDATGSLGYDNSTRRDKRNIKPLDADFMKLLEMQAVTYTRPFAPDRWEIGFIAEDFDAAGLKPLVEYEKDRVTPGGINYEKISLYLTEVAKIQQKRLNAQQATLDAQQKEAAQQKDRISTLEKQVSELTAAVEKLLNRK